MDGQFEQKKKQKDETYDIEHLIACFSPMIRKKTQQYVLSRKRRFRARAEDQNV